MTSSSVPPIGEPPASPEADTTPPTGASTASGSSAAAPKAPAGAAGTSTAARITGRSRPDNWTVEVCRCCGAIMHGTVHVIGEDEDHQPVYGELETVEVVRASTTQGAVDRLAAVERELRAAAIEWRNAEELDGRTIRDDFSRIADLCEGQ
jgi:hypothetical protein